MTNPILHLDLPYQLPDFAAATPEDYRDAITTGMREQLAGLAELHRLPDSAGAAELLTAWEQARAPLARVLGVFFSVHDANSSPETEALEEELSPLLAEHEDKILLDRELYERLRKAQSRIEAGQDAADEQDSYALNELLLKFQRAGVAVAAAQQPRLQELNRHLAELTAVFHRLNRMARNAGTLSVVAEELAGLSPSQKAALLTEGEYRIELVNTTQQPIAASLQLAEVRRRLHQASVSRGLSGEFDTRAVVLEIARARAERATILGYPNHAALVAERGCAKSVSAILEMLVPLAQAALAKAREEAVILREQYETLNPGAEFTSADWSFVAAAVRGDRCNFDESELAEYLNLEKVVAEVHGAATELYGITFTPVEDLKGHTPEAQSYEVHDADGQRLGLLIMDFWARPNKKGGAWMTSPVKQSTLFNTLPVVTTNCNYSRSSQTISWDEVITLFHEFGHALHGLLANSRYPSLSGTNTPRDFIEFPSQVNEHWAWTPGRLLPADLLAKVEDASRFGLGYATAEVQLAALLDLAWHTATLDELPTSAAQVADFERRALERWGLADELVVPRYRSSYFAHIWGGDYASSYYGYTWAEVLDADAVSWFAEQPGSLRESGTYFRETLLAPGGSVDPMETYRRFRGRDPQLQPLLTRLGLQPS